MNRSLTGTPTAAAAAVFFMLTAPTTLAEAPPTALAVVHDPEARTILITAGETPFTTVHYNSFTKPILWPVHGPGGHRMTRDWPMKPDTPGDDKDHPHHKSLWFNHGDVNGVDFWSESPRAGTIVTTAVKRAEIAEDGRAVVELANEWRAPDGHVVCKDTTVIRCGVVGEARLIDYTITVAATQGEVVFGDTKEGSMAVRSRPELNVERKNPIAAGSSRNREGLVGKSLWGAASAWVDYHAPVEGKTIGFAMFDHPTNLRHPTTWHARDYGLVAANPFGLHDFSKDQPKGAGNFTIPADSSHTWRYGIFLYQGEQFADAIETAWKQWAAH